MSLTPTEPLVQKMVHNIYATWTMPTVIAKFFMMGEAIHVRIRRTLAYVIYDEMHYCCEYKL